MLFMLCSWYGCYYWCYNNNNSGVIDVAIRFTSLNIIKIIIIILTIMLYSSLFYNGYSHILQWKLYCSCSSSSKTLEVLSIDFLPSLLPKEASERFAEKMTPYLKTLNQVGLCLSISFIVICAHSSFIYCHWEKAMSTCLECPSERAPFLPCVSHQFNSFTWHTGDMLHMFAVSQWESAFSPVCFSAV